jgi:IS5 family transposase
MPRARLVRLAQTCGVTLRQSYARVGKIALIRRQRYAHAKQLKRANRSLKTLRTYLGRIIRDIGRKIAGNADLTASFAQPLRLARRVLEQRRGQRGPKIYSLHAPEVACIGKGKAHKPFEFGLKVSVATPLQRCRGGQFVAHVAALPGNPYDGHTLTKVIPAITDKLGVSPKRVIADAGYRGHNAPKAKGLQVYTSGQKRGVTEQIKRELRRRSAVEPVIGHLKGDHRMDRNFLAEMHGDTANAVLAAAGYNFKLILRWLEALLCALAAIVTDQRRSSTTLYAIA